MGQTSLFTGYRGRARQRRLVPSRTRAASGAVAPGPLDRVCRAAGEEQRFVPVGPVHEVARGSALHPSRPAPREWSRVAAEPLLQRCPRPTRLQLVRACVASCVCIHHSASARVRARGEGPKCHPTSGQSIRGRRARWLSQATLDAGPSDLCRVPDARTFVPGDSDWSVVSLTRRRVLRGGRHSHGQLDEAPGTRGDRIQKRAR